MADFLTQQFYIVIAVIGNMVLWEHAWACQKAKTAYEASLGAHIKGAVVGIYGFWRMCYVEDWAAALGGSCGMIGGLVWLGLVLWYRKYPHQNILEVSSWKAILAK